MFGSVRALGLLLGLLTSVAPSTFADTKPVKFSCEALLVGERSAATPYLRQKAVENHSAIEAENPRPGFADHKYEASRQQRGLIPPLWLVSCFIFNSGVVAMTAPIAPSLK